MLTFFFDVNTTVGVSYQKPSGFRPFASKSENKDAELLNVINQIEALVSDETVLPRTGRGHASFNKKQKEERQRYEKLIRAVCEAYFVKLDEEIMPHKVVSPRCSTGATTGVMLQY